MTDNLNKGHRAFERDFGSDGRAVDDFAGIAARINENAEKLKARRAREKAFTNKDNNHG